MTRRIRSFALLLVTPLAAACGGSAGSGGVASPSATQQVTIRAGDNFRFDPATIHAHVGKLRIVLVNSGSYPHNISFPALRATSSTVSGNPGGQRTTITLSLAHKGTYDFECTFHSSAGMKGRVTVS